MSDIQRGASQQKYRRALTPVRTFLTVRNLLTLSLYPKMITSRLTSKAQTTIPQPVRAALNLKEGDELIYQIEEGRVTISKARRKPADDDPFRTFSEWSSEADMKAYADL